jgi:hypothetical protein
LNTLPDVEKDLSKPSSSGTKRNHKQTLLSVKRWEEFILDAASYKYPTTPIGTDVMLPITTEVVFRLERNVDTVIENHLGNFNRIFRDQGKAHRFGSRISAAPKASTQADNGVKFIGVPDHFLTLNSKVLSFVEDKTPNDLPVTDPVDGHIFDLLKMYEEDVAYVAGERVRPDIGRTDVCHLVDQVYGYLSLNNLLFGCVTCYDATYFLWRPLRGILLMSHPILNGSRSPTLLQALYYFVQLVLEGHENGEQTLDASPKDSDMPLENSDREETDTRSQGHSDSASSASSSSASNYSSADPGERDYYEDEAGRLERTKHAVSGNAEMDTDEPHERSETGSNNSCTEQSQGDSNKNKITNYKLDLNALRSGTVVGSGATGQVIRLQNSNIVVKHCDKYNNPDGYQMLKN